MNAKMHSFFRYIIVVFVLGALWEMTSFVLESGVLPRPYDAVSVFWKAVQTKNFWIHFLVSAWRATAGMALAWMVAFPLGLVMGSVEKIDRFLAPFVFLTYPVPKIVLLPIFLVLFGLGDLSKIGMISFILGYQILVTTRDGVKAIHPKYFDSVRSMGGGSFDIFLNVLIPAALPHGMTALRLGTGVSVAVLFFVESFATTQGLGYLIMDAWGSMDYAGMFTGIFGMSILGALLYECANLLERHFCSWQANRGR
ncbi:MAG: ABC transporter permease [Desulfovibrio sp.]